MRIGSKHVCARLEFEFANGLSENCRIEFDLLAVMLGNMFPG